MDTREWLETDGLGGFASGTVAGVRTRRYHGLLLAALQPSRRWMLVNGLEVVVRTPSGSFALSSQRYADGTVFPDGHTHLESFRREPWPTWTYRLPDGTRLEHELFMPHGHSAVALRWSVLSGREVELSVRPLLSGRDYHALHHENPAFAALPIHQNGQVVWRAYPGVPAVAAQANGRFFHQPVWYRSFFYESEAQRGFDATEDLVGVGRFEFGLADGPAVLLLAATNGGEAEFPRSDAAASFDAWRDAEARRRARFPSPLHRAADQYLIAAAGRRTIVAGYPWFTDWGRDTFIALRGLCMATGRLDEARDILLSWTGSLSEGMLPNRFPDGSGEPEYNSVDASLWYVVAAGELLDAADARAVALSATQSRDLLEAVARILDGYAAGTRHGIREDADGLLSCGGVGTQLTWMDARADGREITPRVGKPVEIQALWINALAVGARRLGRRFDLDAARTRFVDRFWNEARGGLYDVVDVDHEPGRVDDAVRPNQVYAVGGLPIALLEGERARRTLQVVESELLTPRGLRSLAASSPAYAGRYEGGPAARDAVYHQGTAWPFLMGAFVEAHLRVHGNRGDALETARARFLQPLRAQLDVAGLGHVSEIADGDAPHEPRGCPFQAWSTGELIRIERMLSA